MWLFQEAAEHYQVNFATGVKGRKVGSPFSLTLLFPRLWRTSQQWRHQFIISRARNSKHVCVKHVQSGIAWVASVSVRFRSKKRGTRVKDRAKNGASKRAGRGGGSFLSPSPLFHFLPFVSLLARRKQKIPFLGLFLLRNQTERLLRRLSRVSYRFQIDSSYTSGGARTLRVGAIFLENGEEKLRFQTNTDTCGQGHRQKELNWICFSTLHFWIQISH